MKQSSRDKAEHYTWSSAISAVVCDGWHLHRSDTLSVIEERMPPAIAEQPHMHQQATQFFYVSAGDITLEIDGRALALTPGEACTIYPNTPHQVFNRSEQDVRFLVISQPPSRGGRHPADRVAVEARKCISNQ